MRRVLGAVEMLLRFTVAAFVVAIVLLVSAQILFRYAFAAPIVWSEEATTLCYQWLSYLGAALAVRYRGHFGVDFIARHLHARWGPQLERLGHVVVWAVGLFMIFYGARIVQESAAQAYPTLPFAVGTGYLILPIAGVLFLLMDLALLLDKDGAPRGHAA